MEAQGRVFQGVISTLDDRREYRAYLTRMFPRSESEKARNRPVVLLANNERGNLAGPHRIGKNNERFEDILEI